MLEMTGKSLLITGGTGSLGRALTLRKSSLAKRSIRRLPFRLILPVSPGPGGAAGDQPPRVEGAGHPGALLPPQPGRAARRQLRSRGVQPPAGHAPEDPQ